MAFTRLLQDVNKACSEVRKHHVYQVEKQCAIIIHGLLNLPALEFARAARSQDKSVRVGAVPTAGHAPAACDTAPRPARAARTPRPPGTGRAQST